MVGPTYEMLLKLETALRRGNKSTVIQCLFNDPKVKGLFRSCNMCLVQSTCIEKEIRKPKPLVYNFCLMFNKPCENIVNDLINIESIKDGMTMVYRNSYMKGDVWKVIIDAPPVVIKTKKKRKKK